MVLAFQPGSPGSTHVQTLYFGHAFIHFFLYYGLCSEDLSANAFNRESYKLPLRGNQLHT